MQKWLKKPQCGHLKSTAKAANKLPSFQKIQIMLFTVHKKEQKNPQNTKKDFWSLLELQVKGMSIQ